MLIVQTYYPFVSENDMKMMLETDSNRFLLRFQNFGSQMSDFSLRTLAGLILNRLSNNLINGIQTAYEATLSGTRPD